MFVWTLFPLNTLTDILWFDKHKQEGYSSASTPVLVYTRTSYRTVNKDYTQEYILFTLFAAMFLLLPFSVWQKQKQASAAVSQAIKKKKAA